MSVEYHNDFLPKEVSVYSGSFHKHIPCLNKAFAVERKGVHTFYPTLLIWSIQTCSDKEDLSSGTTQKRSYGSAS